MTIWKYGARIVRPTTSNRMSLDLDFPTRTELDEWRVRHGFTLHVPRFPNQYDHADGSTLHVVYLPPPR